METEKAIREIRQYTRGQLREFWQFIREQHRDQTPNPGLLHHDMVADKSGERWKGGQAFEYMILRFFELDGAEVTYPYGPIIGLDGMKQETDGFIYAQGLRCMVESKDWSREVGMSTVAKLKDRMLHRNSQLIGSIFCSRNGFNRTALSAAFLEQSRYNILLWDGDEIDCLISQPTGNFVKALHTKYRISLERLLPNFNTCAENPDLQAPKNLKF